MDIAMDRSALQAFLEAHFPQAADYEVDAVTPDGVVMRLCPDARHLRPGETVSGPTMFALADVGIYLAILSRIGPVALAVTTNASIDFLRKPLAGRDLRAEVRILKIGRQLAVGEAILTSEGSREAVARASMTYSIPPQRGVK